MTSATHILKRNGNRELFQVHLLESRLALLSKTLNVDCKCLAKKIARGVYPEMSSIELDEFAATTAATMSLIHTDYSVMAARIAVVRLHKMTESKFSTAFQRLRGANIVASVSAAIVKKHAARFDTAIVDDRDFNFDHFGFRTLERSFLLRIANRLVERPQYMWMRVAIGIHGFNVNAALETYDLLSRGLFIHASPTLFHAATLRPQLSSCFLLTNKEDSIKGVYATLTDTALISKMAGGVGLSVHDVRAHGSIVANAGTASGLVPMLRVFDATAKYVDQGGNKRPGAIAVYVEPWHADIFDFLELKKNTGLEQKRARNLFYGLWVPDLFMRRVDTGAMWSLMCPKQSPGLNLVYGDEFERMYVDYERRGLFVRQIPSRQLWHAILEAQIETGTPYMLYKDACNRKSNQRNLGTIQCSNLCAEIIEYASPNETAVCNLASVSLPRFVLAQNHPENPVFDYDGLRRTIHIVVQNLNKIIDINNYPDEASKTSNLRHRPIGIGVQGLADTFFALRLPYESSGARQLNRYIFETIYFAALETSCHLASLYGTYESYAGSPASHGLLQYDWWDTTPEFDAWDWPLLKADIARCGLRNSLLVAAMPTATTAQILGNTESFEPITNNMYVRRVLSGEFQVINKYLLADLALLGLWTEPIRHSIMAANGSIQHLNCIPQHLRDLYKTCWEIKQRTILQMAADRGAFIDQSQSLNIFFDVPTRVKLTSMHFQGWRLGLKTGMYYLRTKPAVNAIKFTIDKKKADTALQCSLTSEECSSCSA